MKILIKLLTLLAVLCAVACSQTFENESNSNLFSKQNVKAKGQLAMNVAEASRTITNIFTNADIYSAELTANGEVVGNWSGENVINQIESDSSIILDVGDYDFVLSVKNQSNETLATAKNHKTITGGKNYIDFYLESVTTGIGCFEVTFSWQSEDVSSVKAGLYNCETAEEIEGYEAAALTISEKTAVYAKEEVPVGQYMLMVKFYDDSDNLLKSYTEVLQVEVYGKTTATKTFAGFNTVYSVTYLLPDGETWKEDFTPVTNRKTFEAVELPTIENINTENDISVYTLKWYTTATFDVGTEIIKINAGTEKDMTVYAKIENCCRTTAEGFVDTITGLEDGGPYNVIVTGELTAESLAVMVTAMNENFAKMINLDLSDTTGLTSIGDYYAFSGCTGLTSVTIPDSVTKIGYDAFYGCDSLTSVIFENTSGWNYSNYSDGTNGTEIDVTDAVQNATYLTDTYCGYYWYKVKVLTGDVINTNVYSYKLDIEDISTAYGGTSASPTFSVVLATDMQGAYDYDYRISAYGNMKIADTSQTGDYVVYGQDVVDGEYQYYTGIAATVTDTTFELIVDMSKIKKTEFFNVPSGYIDFTEYKPYVVALGSYENDPDNSVDGTGMMRMTSGATFPANPIYGAPKIPDCYDLKYIAGCANGWTHELMDGDSFDFTYTYYPDEDYGTYYNDGYDRFAFTNGSWDFKAGGVRISGLDTEFKLEVGGSDITFASGLLTEGNDYTISLRVVSEDEAYVKVTASNVTTNNNIYSYKLNIENISDAWGGSKDSPTFSVLLLTDEQVEASKNFGNFESGSSCIYQFFIYGNMKITDTSEVGDYAVWGASAKDGVYQYYTGVATTVTDTTLEVFVDMSNIAKTELKSFTMKNGEYDNEYLITETDIVKFTGYKPYVIALGTQINDSNNYAMTGWTVDIMKMNSTTTFPTNPVKTAPSVATYDDLKYIAGNATIDETGVWKHVLMGDNSYDFTYTHYGKDSLGKAVYDEFKFTNGTWDFQVGGVEITALNQEFELQDGSSCGNITFADGVLTVGNEYVVTLIVKGEHEAYVKVTEK